MDYKSIILSQENIKKYCKQFKYPIVLRGKTINLLCPYCNDKSMTALCVGQTHHIDCVSPNCPHKDKKFTLVAIVRKVEKDKKDWDREKIIQYIKNLFQVKALTPQDVKEQHKWFDYYIKNGFSLTPIKPNDKVCIESEWQNKEHKDPSEWKEWIKNGLNVGLNCNMSKKMIIDIDQKPIPKEIENLIGNTLIEESKRGFHLFYQQDQDLPKTSIGEFTLVDQEGKEHFIKNPNFQIKLNGRNTTLRKMEIGDKTMIKINNEEKLVTMKSYLKIDIENSNNEQGAQVVIYPSICEDYQRKFINENEIIIIPKKFKEYLQSKIGTIAIPTNSEIVRQEIQNDTYKLPLIEEGEGRHSFLFRYACILRKQMSVAEVESAIVSLNKIVNNPPLEYKEIKNILNSTNMYSFADDKELAEKILEYLREVDEATNRDIERAIAGDNRLKAEEKSKIDKAIAYLKKEEFIKSKKNKLFLVKKMEWTNNLIDTLKQLPFKVPYFHDLGRFCWKDILVIGATPGIGKTHIALNIIKKLSEQGIYSHYVSLETGSRHIEIALQLGLTEKDFRYNKEYYNPLEVELEKNAVTVIDWLNPVEFENTHLIFEHFAKQLCKHNGLLIIFVQLKENGSFFAPNLMNIFPALTCKYFYEDGSDGTYGHFEICKIRESIRKKRLVKIPCMFKWETKELVRTDELKENENIKDEQIIVDEKEE